MKIYTSFCDLHPTCEMRKVDIGVVAPPYMNRPAFENALRCTAPQCFRHWTEDHGYFPHIDGEAPNYGNVDDKPCCGKNHHVLRLVVTKVAGVLVWACPWNRETKGAQLDLNCPTTQPFDAAMSGVSVK